MHTKSAKYYDKLYAFKDYLGETEKLRSLIDRYKRSDGDRLLDIACGTGNHISHLKKDFRVEGLDINPESIKIAQDKHPEIRFSVADMTDFSLGRRFDVITCLFGSIGYAGTVENLHRTISHMGLHLTKRGVLFIEPWFTPTEARSHTVHGVYIDEPELKLARINTTITEEHLSCFDFHYLVGTSEKTEYFVEHHELGLFTEEEMTFALTKAGLEVFYDTEGLTGRGLYIACKS